MPTRKKKIRKSKPARAKPRKKAARGGPAKKPKAAAAAWPPPENRICFFDPLDLIRRVLMAHDMLFLSRQVSYHIAAAPALPKVWADPNQIGLAFTKLVEQLLRRAPRGSRIFINLKEFALRSGPGVELSIAGADKHLSDEDDSSVLTVLFERKAEGSQGISLAECREIIHGQRGQMWADIPKHNHPTYHIVLPASEEPAQPAHGGHQTFKYDISISNYAMVRKRFGIKKSEHLVEEIERYVRSLVRYPMDMVMAMGDKGIITAIYESQQGSAESVASRISKRLGKEEFRIGRKPVELSFHYHLSPLHARGGPRVETHHKRSS
ncbi:MAG: hypothetical protein WC956_07515 [bacterium]